MNTPQFDRDIALAELLRAIPGVKLHAALAKLLGDDWQIIDADGVPLLGPGSAAKPGNAAALIAMPLRVNFEIIGKLLASHVPHERVEATAAWLELVLVSALRYRMAADLHIEAVNADYAALQREHTALQKSEARYRELAAQLEQRVAEQIAVIQRTQRQLYQSEKMAAVGSLAAGMAHEINNPVGFIRSNLNTALGYVGTMSTALDAFRHGDSDKADTAWRKADIDFVLEDFPGLLAQSITGADRIAYIVANLKAYASIDCASAIAADLNDTVRTVAGIIGDQISEHVALEIDLQPLPDILCDQSRINQVVFALVQNARQAIGTEGLIRISTRVADGEVRIAVGDNGCGIASDILNRIFDPFFTTQDVGKGTGLGLTVSRDIIAAHGGRIDVDSTVGVGSTFTVCLPLAASAEIGSAPKRSS